MASVRRLDLDGCSVVVVVVVSERDHINAVLADVIVVDVAATVDRLSVVDVAAMVDRLSVVVVLFFLDRLVRRRFLPVSSQILLRHHLFISIISISIIIIIIIASSRANSHCAQGRFRPLFSRRRQNTGRLTSSHRNVILLFLFDCGILQFTPSLRFEQNGTAPS